MTQPSKVIQIEMNTLKKVLKEQIIQGNFDSNNYTSKEFGLILEMARKIPVSILHKKNIEINSKTTINVWLWILRVYN